MSRKQFSPVTPLSTFWIELGISRSTGKKIEKHDPDFPLDEGRFRSADSALNPALASPSEARSVTNRCSPSAPRR